MPVKRKAENGTDGVFDVFSRPAGVYSLLALLVFFPCLFLGWAYFDNDPIQSYSFFQRFLREGFLRGRLPLWDPYLMGGQPFFADPSTLSCYPLTYPILLFPLPLGHGVFCSLHLFLAFLGMHFWLRTLGLEERSCYLGSLAFGFSGFFWLEVIHPQVLGGLAWAPWFLGALERLVRNPKPSNAFAAGIFFALLFLVGQFQITLAMIYAGVAYFLFRARDGGGIKTLGFGRMTALAGLFLFSALPLLALWVPAREYFLQSARQGGVLDYRTFNADLSLEYSRLYQFLWPEGMAYSDRKPGEDFTGVIANAGFLGIWFPFFLFWAFRGRRRKLAFLCLGIGLTAFLIALGRNFPLHQWACRWLPGFSQMRAVYRFLFLDALFLPVLTALGSQTFLEKLDRGKGEALPAVWAFAAVLGGMGIYFFPTHWSQNLGLAAGVLAFGAWSGWGRSWGQRLFFLSWTASLWAGAWALCPSRLGPSSNFDFKERLPGLTTLEEKTGHSRIFIRSDIPYPVLAGEGPATIGLPVNVALDLRLKNVRGYNSISLARVEKLSRLPEETLARLLAVRAVVTAKDWGGIRGYRKLESGSLAIHLCEEERPFVFCPTQVRTVPDADEVLTAMARGGFRPYRHAFLSEPLPVPGSAGARLSYSWVKDEPDEQAFDLRLDRPSLTVFSEVNYPGWRARVDGVEQKILTADGFLRALYLPPGEHQVEFRFHPAWIPWLEGEAVLWLTSLLFFLRYRRKLDRLWETDGKAFPA